MLRGDALGSLRPQMAVMTTDLAGVGRFEAIIVPHRSLSARGLRALLIALGLLGGLTSTLVWLMGAWPIIGFTGGEGILAIALLRYHARGVRETEYLLLTEAEMRVVRTDRHGRRRERVLPAAWLNVILRERQGRVPGLFLASHGLEEEVATALGEVEKRDLARALADSLRAARNPVFDNPQLQL